VPPFYARLALQSSRTSHGWPVRVGEPRSGVMSGKSKGWKTCPFTSNWPASLNNCNWVTNSWHSGDNPHE
jgi:hypothetical protein